MLPLGSRNALLLAAGFAPVFPASPLAATELAPLRAALELMMQRHAPYPALLCDRHWMLLDANAPARALLAPFQSGDAAINLVRILTETELAQGVIANLPEVIEEFTARIRMEAMEAGEDAVLDDLLRGLEVTRERFPLTSHSAPRRPLSPIVLNTPLGQLRFLSAITQFGTSEDVTVRDLRLELFFPADEATRAAMGG